MGSCDKDILDYRKKKKERKNNFGGKREGGRELLDIHVCPFIERSTSKPSRLGSSHYIYCVIFPYSLPCILYNKPLNSETLLFYLKLDYPNCVDLTGTIASLMDW